jgi:hypothetical protein
MICVARIEALYRYFLKGKDLPPSRLIGRVAARPVAGRNESIRQVPKKLTRSDVQGIGGTLVFCKKMNAIERVLRKRGKPHFRSRHLVKRKKP